MFIHGNTPPVMFTLLVVLFATWKVIVAILPGNIVISPGSSLTVTCDNTPIKDIIFSDSGVPLEACTATAGSLSGCSAAGYTFGTNTATINEVKLENIVQCKNTLNVQEMMMIIIAENVNCGDDQIVEAGSTVNITCQLPYRMAVISGILEYLPYLLWKDDNNEILINGTDSETPGQDMELSYIVTVTKSTTYTCEAFFPSDPSPDAKYPPIDDTIPVFPAGTDSCKVNIIIPETTTVKSLTLRQTEPSVANTDAANTNVAYTGVTNTDVENTIGVTTTVEDDATTTSPTTFEWHNSYFVTVAVGCSGFVLTLMNFYQTMNTGIAQVAFQQPRMVYNYRR